MRNTKGISIHIGVNSVDPAHYEGWSGPLNACHKDAHDMRDIAQANGFSPTVLLTEQATRAAVLSALENAAATLEAGDILLVTYSGHGGQVEDISFDEDDSVDETWCLFDGQLLDDELFFAWCKIAAGVRILFISDSCHSGTVYKSLVDESNETPPLSGTPRVMPSEEALNTYLANKEFYDKLSDAMPDDLTETDLRATVLSIASCQDNELSLETPFNGKFTAQLKRAWKKGRFDGNYHALYEAIGANLSEQTPRIEISGTIDHDFSNQKPFQI